MTMKDDFIVDEIIVKLGCRRSLAARSYNSATNHRAIAPCSVSPVCLSISSFIRSRHGEWKNEAE